MNDLAKRGLMHLRIVCYRASHDLIIDPWIHTYFLVKQLTEWAYNLQRVKDIFPRRRLFVKGDSARIQNETAESSAWFFSMCDVSNRHMGSRFKISPERRFVIVR